ncbi:hypothetical protein Taro_019787 [Colocasia esculenta]|uniref:Uncharacterized protein n=1 Tax=Colocasia esculenta TaxID=4460 RepID=A0A843UX65_COLES|nr:hypothetical protein [Colocasia esculenta]
MVELFRFFIQMSFKLHIDEDLMMMTKLETCGRICFNFSSEMDLSSVQVLGFVREEDTLIEITCLSHVVT